MYPAPPVTRTCIVPLRSIGALPPGGRCDDDLYGSLDQSRRSRNQPVEAARVQGGVVRDAELHGFDRQLAEFAIRVQALGVLVDRPARAADVDDARGVRLQE